MLDSQQLINGVAVLITFFVGYKYGLRMGRDKDPAKVEKQKEATVGRVIFYINDVMAKLPITSLYLCSCSIRRGTIR